MTLESYEISNPEFMCMQQEKETLYGCNQDWYRIEWRRRAGCGPVAATNILVYLRKKFDIKDIPYQNSDVEEALVAMNDVFLYVRPRRRGLHTVRKFVKGMCKFGRRYGVSFWYQFINVPPQVEMRPDLDAVARFIEDALNNDVPVAFLNLDAGDVEEQLQSWHWVTVVGMSKNAISGSGGQNIVLRYFDQSKSIEVDLGKWLGTTVRGGGFAYFCRPTRRRPISKLAGRV